MCTPGWPRRFGATETTRYTTPLSEPDARWWNTRFLDGWNIRDDTGIFPDELVELLSDGIQGLVVATFTSFDREGERFELTLDGLDEDGAKLFFNKKCFELGRGIVGNGETRVEPDRQGRGIGTQLMINLIEFARKAEIDRIDIDAQDIGRYVWLLMGFLPDATSWRRFIVPAARRRLTIARALGEISPATYASAEQILADRDPASARQLLLLTELVEGVGPQGESRKVSLCTALMLYEGTDWSGSFILNEANLDHFDVYKEAHGVRHPKL